MRPQRNSSQPWRAAIFAAGFLAAVAMSAAAGTPPTTGLPTVSLGWPLLLHLERAGAIVAILAVITVVGWRASKGELPTRFANIEYRVDGARDSIASIERRLAWLEFEVAMRDDPPLDDGGGGA